MMIVLGTQSEKFTKYEASQGGHALNGAFFYAEEIENNILPAIGDVDVTIVTTGATLYKSKELPNGAIVVCHDNRRPISSYRLLLRKNILWICSKHSTVDKMRGVGEKAIYIPLSIDTSYVEKFKTEKTEAAAFVGNPWGFKKRYLNLLPKDIVQLSGLEREDLLREMAKYRRVIAEGRCLMEAQVLGAETEVPRYEDGIESVYVEALDNKDTIPYWKLALEAHADIQKRET